MPQSNPIFCTSSAGVHSAGQHQALADMGFNFVAAEVWNAREWEREIKGLHHAGLKFIARWPNWSHLGLLKDEYGFRAADGMHNPQEGYEARLAGPSYWCEEAEERALENLPAMVELGVDGLILSPLLCDRPYPTDWFPFNSVQHTTAIWSHDKWAKRAWEQVSDGYPMPAQAVELLEGRDDCLRFYRWYQAAWIGRLTRMAQAAMAVGIKHIWSWYVPLVRWDEDGIADCTADSLPAMEGWRQAVLAGGGDPVTVSACLFGLWPRWKGQGLDAMRQATRQLGWTSIVGAEIQGDVETAMFNLEHNGEAAAQVGFSGLFCGDSLLLADPPRTTEVLRRVRSCFVGA